MLVSFFFFGNHAFMYFNNYRKNEEIDQNLLKKCVNCGSNFGILDKKFICSICALNMCVSCSKFMVKLYLK